MSEAKEIGNHFRHKRLLDQFLNPQTVRLDPKKSYTMLQKLNESFENHEGIDDFQPCTYDQMRQVSDLLKGIKFFTERNIKQQQELDEIGLNLLLESFEKNAMVFDQGDVGEKFYIILRGSVEVQIQLKHKLSTEELN